MMFLCQWHVLVIFLCPFCVSCTEESPDYSGFVKELDSDNFDATILENPVILVEFYAPWCGHCKSLAPEYEKAAAMLAATNLTLAKVDATEHTELATRFGVTGYPTLKVFHDGVPFDYEGKRTTEGIVSYMYQESLPDWAPPPNHVLVLTADNFTATVDAAPLTLVEFYAPWCGHCKKLEPEFKKAALELYAEGISLAKVDATVEKELASKYDVSGYPALIMFRNGQKYTYNGPRDKRGIVQYMVGQSKPATSSLGSSKELTSLLKKDSPPLLVLCSPQVDNEYLQLANSGRDSILQFLHSPSQTLCDEIGLDWGSAAIIMPYFYRSSQEPWLIPVDLSKSDLPQLLRASRPLVGVRTRSTSEAWYSEYPLLVAYLEIDTSKDGEKDFQFWRDKLAGVARGVPGVTVAMSNEKEYERELAAMGIADRGADVSMVMWTGPKEKYIMEEDDDDLQQFIESSLSGELQPHRQSQARPRSNKGPVLTVVGSSFQEIVMDPTKNVLVEFYAPWCGHCKQLEPIYKELGKKFKKNKQVIIAKFDATANDAPPEFEFTGFPTIYFVRAGTNEIVLYDGDRDIKAMIGFVKKELKRKDEL